MGTFFKYSPKRQRKLEKSITEIATESLKKKVKPLSETHWVEKDRASIDLSQLYESILHCLESISLNNNLNNRFNPHAVTQASGLRKQLWSLSLTVCFRKSKYLYDYTKGLLQQLQGSTAEIAQAYEMVFAVAAQLNDIRDDAASEFQIYLQSANPWLFQDTQLIPFQEQYPNRLCETMLNMRMQNIVTVALYSFRT